MALHEQSLGATDEWYTPPHVFKALGCTFDLDVAAPADPLPWIPAKRSLTSASLQTPWSGFIWMNPPFGPRNGLEPWLAKFVEHGDGVALTPDRTSAPWWQQFAPMMDRILLVDGKLKFLDANWRPGESPAQGTTLMAIGPRGVAALQFAEARGLGSQWMRAQPALPTPERAATGSSEGGK